VNKWDPKYTHQLEGKKAKRGGTHEQIAHLPVVFIHASKKAIKSQYKSTKLDHSNIHHPQVNPRKREEKKNASSISIPSLAYYNHGQRSPTPAGLLQGNMPGS
jgi:hypothetical protein